MSEPVYPRMGQSAESYDEPVFETIQPPLEEPVFAPESVLPVALPEPIFEAVPATARGVSLPAEPTHSQIVWDIPSPEPAPSLPFTRRLGRTTPVWAVLSVAAIVLLVALWFSLGQQDPPESVEPTGPALGVVGSVVLLDATPSPSVPEAIPATAAPPPTRLGAGMRVLVGNTNGQGIRLRSAPGTASLTLGIYDDAAPFLVLSPGGDYGEYPVEVDGYFWYRIRVAEDPADQLVGWAAGDFLVTGE